MGDLLARPEETLNFTFIDHCCSQAFSIFLHSNLLVIIDLKNLSYLVSVIYEHFYAYWIPEVARLSHDRDQILTILILYNQRSFFLTHILDHCLLSLYSKNKVILHL